MYLPRQQLSSLYTHLTSTHNATNPPLLILTALTVDALCAVRILTALLKRDFIPHTVVPVSGYADLQDAGERLVQPLKRGAGGAGDGGRVVCIGCGGGVDLSELLLGLTEEDEAEQDSLELAAQQQGHGVEIWVIDARRPWNLENIFGNGYEGEGVKEGRILEHYQGGRGGVIVWDDGDIEREMDEVKEAWMGLRDMPEITEDDIAIGNAPEDGEDAAAGDEERGDDAELSSSQGKRKRSHSPDDHDPEAENSDGDDERPSRRRRSNSGTPIPSSPGGNPMSNQLAATASPSAPVPSSPPAPKAPSLKQQKKDLLRLRRRHEATLQKYYDAGSWTADPVSIMLYSLAEDLGRDDNELLWLAIVGVESVALSPFASSQTSKSFDEGGRRSANRLDIVKSLLRDEVRRLNPPSLHSQSQPDYPDTIPTQARSATDTSIRLSPEPRFLLIRHWSLYDSMLHSTYLSTRLHIWSESGRKRLHKLLAKMGISLSEAQKGYVHLDLEIKRSLNQRLSRFAEQYNLDGLVPGTDYEGKTAWGFIRSWGWRGTLSAVDVATVVSAILEVGPSEHFATSDLTLGKYDPGRRETFSASLLHRTRQAQQGTTPSGLPSPPHSSDDNNNPNHTNPNPSDETPDYTTTRFFLALDSLSPSTASHTTAGLPTLLHHLPIAQTLARAILRTGSHLISKKQIRHLRAFRMGVVREGPDLGLFVHPGALVKLGRWVGEAVGVLEAEKNGGRKREGSGGKKGEEEEALVLAALDEGRGVYVVVGLGGGSDGVGRVRSRREIREREERRQRRGVEKAERKAERGRVREERRRLRREMREANGDLESEDEEEEEESSGSESDSSEDDEDEESEGEEGGLGKRGRRKGPARNRFGQAFQEVVEETGARVRIDSFEHSVVEVRKEDLAGFLEGLSLKSVVG
ncbi:CDC45-like protein [Hortaea werneckii]|nr:CDC45-like protein [Hortaea werneckii]